jgi:CheY-like chemotaxis protein
LGIRERVGWLGGFLKVHSEPGRGSRFVLGVPDAQLQGHTKNSIKKMAEKATKPKTPGKKARSVVRVVLADDHWSVREGLARLLEEEPDVQVVGEADNGKQAVDLVQQLHPDIVVMDVSMPVMNGVDATCLIKRQFPGVRIVALSMFEQDDVAQSMIDAGAEAYLRKSGPSEELLRAIRGTTV